MTYTITVGPEARDDLKAIYDYIKEQDSASKAKNFIYELQNSINSLESMPFRCRTSIYNNDDAIRDHIYKGYTIVFKVHEHTVYVLSIFRQKAI